jgi:hypothetical protein
VIFVGHRVRLSSLISLAATVLLAALISLLLVSPARAEVSGTPDEGTAQVDGRVRAIMAVGDRIYIGGDFTSVDGVPRNRLAALDASTGELVPNWDPSAEDSVRALAASPDGTRIYVGGAFTSIDGLSRGRLAALDPATGAVTAWRPAPASGGPVRAIAVSGNRVYTGGSFTSVGGQGRPYLALIDATTGALNPNWAPTPNNLVRTMGLSADGSRLYVGGDFTTVSGSSRPYLAAFDATTGAVDTVFRPPSPNGLIHALALSGTRVFTAEDGAGGAAGAYDASTGVRAWRHSADGDAEAITVLGTKVYIGGHFEVFSGQSRRSFAAVDAGTGALDPQWIPNAQPSGTDVFAMASDASRGRVYAGGDFTGVSGRPHERFAQFSDPSTAATPETTINSGPTGAVNSASANFTFSSSKPNSTFECALDGAGYSPCASPQTYAGLSDGPHAFEVRATDASGNTDPTSAKRSWTIDTLAPEAPLIVTPPEGGFATANLTLSGTAEAGTTVELFEGGASMDKTQADAGGAWSRTLSGVPDGSHTYTAKAIDAAGNASSLSQARTVIVDGTPPQTTIDSGESGTVSSRDATFAFSSSEAGSSFQCSLDGVTYSTCTSPKTYTGLSNGNHTFRVRATDAAGNNDPTPASRTWKVRVR